MSSYKVRYLPQITPVHVAMSRFVLPLMLLLFGFRFSEAISQRSESVVPNHNPQTHQGFVDHAPGSRRHFVSTSNAVAISPLIQESHHDVTPESQPTRFATTATGLPSTHTSLERLAAAVHANPVLAALLISSLLGTPSGPKPAAYNTPAHEPPNPYVALLLSHYGRYIPRPGLLGHGLYGYNAANNIHNTKPFGSYKIYEDSS